MVSQPREVASLLSIVQPFEVSKDGQESWQCRRGGYVFVLEPFTEVSTYAEIL
jgi:hypothetical protein